MKPQTDIKYSNQRKLLKLLLSKQANTRTDLARLSGLSKMTVTNLINEWIEDHYFVERREDADQSRGRPKMILDLSSKAPKVIGLLLRNNDATIIVANLYGAIEHHCSKEIKDNSLEVIDELVNGILAKYINSKFLALGIVNLDSTVEESVIAHIKGKLSIPVISGTKESSLCLFEHQAGQFKSYDRSLLINIDKEVSAAMMEDGKICPRAPDIAHVSIDYNGLTCKCGRKGCLCAYISKPIMEKKLRDISKLKLDFAGFCQYQNKKNDSRIDWALKDMAEKIGYGIANVCIISGINKVALAGEANYIPDRYIAKLEKDLQADLNDKEFALVKSSLLDSDSNLLPINIAIASIIN